MIKRIDIVELGAVSGSDTPNTVAIQNAIDKASEWECEVYVPTGVFVTGSLYLKNNMSLHLAGGAVLQGERTEDASADGRVAVLNIAQATHVRVFGTGTISGKCSGFTANVMVQDSNDVQLEDFTAISDVAETVHICNSENVRVKGLDIPKGENADCDGIIIASGRGILVEQCKIACGGDNVSIQSGCCDKGSTQEDRIWENIMVRDCEILEGHGIGIVCKNAEGMRTLSVCDNAFRGTDCGFSLMAAGTEGGLIEEVIVENLKMENVKCCFRFVNNHVPGTDKSTQIRNVRISKVSSVLKEDYRGASKAFDIVGRPDAPFEDVSIEEVQLQAVEYGTIANIKKLYFNQVTVNIVS